MGTDSPTKREVSQDPVPAPCASHVSRSRRDMLIDAYTRVGFRVVDLPDLADVLVSDGTAPLLALTYEDLLRAKRYLYGPDAVQEGHSDHD